MQKFQQNQTKTNQTENVIKNVYKSYIFNRHWLIYYKTKSNQTKPNQTKPKSLFICAHLCVWGGI